MTYSRTFPPLSNPVPDVAELAKDAAAPVESLVLQRVGRRRRALAPCRSVLQGGHDDDGRCKFNIATFPGFTRLGADCRLLPALPERGRTVPI